MVNFHSRQFITSHLLLPLLVMMPILWGFELANWDVDFQHLFYNADTHKWLISSRKGWVEVYLHDGGKILTWIYGLLCIAGLMLSFRDGRFKPYCRDFTFILLAVIVATTVVSLLKHSTNINCPKNLTLFGGEATYVKIFQPRIFGDKYGICWPSGHASAGFAFVSAYFVVLRRWPRYAWLALTGGLGMGVLYGSARMIQGLHFLSHTLWSGIICWVAIVVVAMAVFRNEAMPTSNEIPE